MIKRTLTVITMAAAAAWLNTGCADREVHSSTTTTEETSVQHPVEQTTTTETQAVRPAY